MTVGAYGDLARDLRVRNGAGAWHLFLALVSLASLLPFLVAPLNAAHVIPEGLDGLYVVVAIGFLGANFHVALTAWFYTDDEIRPHFRSRPVRYFVMPLVLVAGSATAYYLADRQTRGLVLVLFLCWQLWHYQKQNVGLLSFIAAGTDGVPLSVWERRTLMIAAVAGILGLFSLMDIGPAYLRPWFAYLHQLGAAIYALVPIAFAVAVFRSPALRANRLRLLFFAFGASFFAPTFLFADPPAALLGYILAHGLQYCVFMGFVGVGKPHPVASLVKLLAIAAGGGILLDRAVSAPLWAESAYGYAVYGAFLGVTMTHFVLDADIWRLREPFQRGYMRKKFHFIFSR